MADGGRRSRDGLGPRASGLHSKSWNLVWWQAVGVPAWRRATAVWMGCGIAAIVVFGPTGMQPHDLTGLAIHQPAVAAALGATWLLLYVPTARLLVRAEPAVFLRSLPHARAAPWLLGGTALLAFQLPWVALWLAGEGAPGAIPVAGTTAIAAAAAIPTWRARPARVRRLVGVYAIGARRRAGHAIVRGVGLAIVAGIAGGLLVRNNQLEGRGAAAMASAVTAIVLVPAVAGVLVPLLDAHRAAAWLARSLGRSELDRMVALAAAVIATYLAAGAIAAAAASAVIGRAGAVPLVVLTSAGCGGIAARGMVWADRSVAAPATRVVVGAVIAAALAVLWLASAGAPGAIGLLACAVLALGTASP